ncbi:GIN domain-containing protein [Flavobacterium sp. DSR2-3-3]|uniref:GIN domain-containing protein n=1 Tax=Flavobacterium sp. DSR2-3-3 TaxID=2804632 RepID=UPI003CF0A015
MKKYTVILLLLLSTTLTLAQNKEKIKGSKTVTVEQRQVGNFEALIVEDNLEVHLERGEKTELKIEADENLHDIISLDLSDKILRVYTTKQATNYKKMIVRVTYTTDLNLITSKDESTVNAIQELLLKTITLKAHDVSKLFLNVNTKDFLLQADDKSKIELNLKSENTIIELSKNASLKALVNTTDLKVDMYQKSGATLEGNAVNTMLRLDNNASFTGNKLTTKNADVTTESYSNCSLFTETAVIIDAADKSEIQLLGSPKIEIRKFADEAKLIKKLK